MLPDVSMNSRAEMVGVGGAGMPASGFAAAGWGAVVFPRGFGFGGDESLHPAVEAPRTKHTKIALRMLDRFGRAMGSPDAGEVP